MMLQALRSNMKSTVFLVVIVLFIIPMVLSGVGGGFLGTVAGTDAAKVDGKKIPRSQVAREVFIQKQRLLSQDGVDPNADYLKDENIRARVMERLTNRTALIVAAEEAGLGVTDAMITEKILQQAEFFVDGQFDSQRYRRLLANVGLTPASFKSAISEDLILEQLQQGISASAFLIDKELKKVVTLTKQKRSFDIIEISQDKAKPIDEVSEEQIQAYYDSNQPEFISPEKLSVKYVELSVDALVPEFDVAEEDIQASYEQEINSSDYSPNLRIAHILLETSDEETDKTVQTIRERLEKGETFSDLAKAFSTDAGTAEQGGDLGIMVAGIYPEAFENAVKALEVNGISEPVETDSGTHLIKLLAREQPEIPTLDERRVAIKTAIQRSLAEEAYVERLEQLELLTFESEDLSEVAQELSLQVKSSASFTRTSGPGIAREKRVRDIAFGDEVLLDERNSEVIELDNDRALVLRKAQHQEERIKPLEQVRSAIITKLEKQARDDKLASLADEVIKRIRAGELAQQVADQLSYTYSTFENVERDTSEVDYQYREFVFALPQTQTLELDSTSTSNGVAVIALKQVTEGKESEMPQEQRDALASRLESNLSIGESSAFQKDIFAQADVEIY